MTREELESQLCKLNPEQLFQQTLKYLDLAINASINEESAQERVSELQSEVEELEEQVQNLEGHLDYYGHFDQMKERIDELESDKDTLQSRVDDLESELEEKVDMSDRVDELEAELSEYSDYDQLQSRVDELEAEISDYSNYYDLSIRVDELESELSSTETDAREADELRREVESLQIELVSARKQLRQSSPEETVYVGSPRSNKFHRPSCEYAAPHFNSTWFEFSSHEEAVEAGYKPCQTCRA